jgi:hypothetical protein
MAIARNVGTGITNKIRAGAADDEGTAVAAKAPKVSTPAPTAGATPSKPVTPGPATYYTPGITFTAQPSAAASAQPQITTAMLPGLLAATAQPMLTVNPNVFQNLILQRPDFAQRTTTQVAQAASERLRNAAPAVVSEAVTTVSNKRVAAGEMMRYLERKVIIGEVLNVTAAKWSADTREDFAEAFQMVNTKTDVMDAIVAIAILNDPDLLDELQDENVSDATGDDLLENRRIVAQYPPPGTPLEAPYLVLVAVEYRDTQRAEAVIKSITGDLVEQQGFKLPRGAVAGRGK